MKFKGVLLYEDVPRDEWPDGVSGAFIYKIVDLPPSMQPPDGRGWRVWSSEQANQYSKELEDDFERFDERFGRLDIDQQIDLALSRAEKFGNQLFREFKRENVKDGLTKSEIRQLTKDMRDVKELIKDGSLKALLEELSSFSNPSIPEERVLRYGNRVRVYLGLSPVLTQAELDDGVS